MSVIFTKLRAYVTTSVSEGYGKWGALRPDQRRMIRELCDTCDIFEKAADSCYKENELLQACVEQLQSYGVGPGEKKELAEVRRGTWKTDPFGYERSECSSCGAIGNGGSYCSHCGAKMDGKKGDE